jgi:predicted phosphodiesterase
VKVLVIGDVHGNAEALRAVLAKESDADTTIFLGDAVSPGPQPNETMALLERLSGTFIMGNHDLEVLEPERVAEWPAPWRAFYDWLFDVFDSAGVERIRAFEPGGEYEIDGMRFCLQHGELHGRPSQVLPGAEDERLLTVAEGSNAPMVLFGHSHVQFSREIGGQRFINPGAVGQNRCGHVLACYGVFSDGVYEPRQVGFDPEPWLEAVERIRPLDAFPDFRHWLKEGLLSGYGIGRQEPWTTLAAIGYY